MSRSQVVDKADAKDGDLWFEGSELHGKGIIRTDERCTDCSKTFVMKVNFDLNGNHVMVCPHCGHEHCRVIKDGVVTGDRWSSRNGNIYSPPTNSMWSDVTIGAKSSAVFQHLREKWLQK